MVNPAPAIQKVTDLLTALGGITVYTGVPKSLEAGVNAYVTVGRWDTVHASGGLAEHAIVIDVVLAYRVANQEASVELAVATKAGAFIAAYLPKLRTQLDGTVDSTDLPDFSLNGQPEYQLVAGQEHRLFRGRVPIVMRETY